MFQSEVGSIINPLGFPFLSLLVSSSLIITCHVCSAIMHFSPVSFNQLCFIMCVEYFYCTFSLIMFQLYCYWYSFSVFSLFNVNVPVKFFGIWFQVLCSSGRNAIVSRGVLFCMFFADRIRLNLSIDSCLFSFIIRVHFCFFFM